VKLFIINRQTADASNLKPVTGEGGAINWAIGENIKHILVTDKELASIALGQSII
jgi:hypothetical protein